MNVYDTHNEVSFKGKITEVMGRNNYLVESEQGTKHVSGDVMTKISDIVNRPMGGSNENLEDKEDLESIQSEASDMSEDLEDVISPLNADPYGTTNLEHRICFRRSKIWKDLISDIYQRINCISHFFWIMYIDIMVDVVHSFIDFITISCRYNVDDKCRTI